LAPWRHSTRGSAVQSSEWRGGHALAAGASCAPYSEGRIVVVARVQASRLSGAGDGVVDID
jgi:hypothetical protein